MKLYIVNANDIELMTENQLRDFIEEELEYETHIRVQDVVKSLGLKKPQKGIDYKDLSNFDGLDLINIVDTANCSWYVIECEVPNYYYEKVSPGRYVTKMITTSTLEEHSTRKDAEDFMETFQQITNGGNND